MEKKCSISFILACLLTLFVIKPQSVAAKELSPFQTKIIGNGNFGIYQRLTRRGPACWIGSTRTFRHGNFQASAHVTVEVRSDDNEGIVKADKTPRPGAGSATSWFKHFKTSGHWGKSFAPETKSHTFLMKNARKSPYFNAGMDRAKLT